LTGAGRASRCSSWRLIDYGFRLTALDFDVRACRPSEASVVLELWEQTRSEHASVPDSLGDVQRLLSHDAGSLLVADADGAILGALIAGSDGWRGSMYRLAVRAEHRRAGIGLALVRAGERHLRGKGVNRVLPSSLTRTTSLCRSGRLPAIPKTARSVATFATCSRRPPPVPSSPTRCSAAQPLHASSHCWSRPRPTGSTGS
jgi:GNAT superfamily N-acetyltransferase